MIQNSVLSIDEEAFREYYSEFEFEFDEYQHGDIYYSMKTLDKTVHVIIKLDDPLMTNFNSKSPLKDLLLLGELIHFVEMDNDW